MTEKTKGWTPERRAAQRERILANRPWENSTGPRTRQGKKRASQNSYKNGAYSREMKMIKKYLRDTSAFLQDINLIESLLRKMN